MIIDLKPTWCELLRWVENGTLEVKNLLQACEVADEIRQAQKSGKASITFTFAYGKNGEATITTADRKEIETWVCPECGTDCSAVTCYGRLE